jgi:hypothetical protein
LVRGLAHRGARDTSRVKQARHHPRGTGPHVRSPRLASGCRPEAPPERKQ